MTVEIAFDLLSVDEDETGETDHEWNDGDAADQDSGVSHSLACIF